MAGDINNKQLPPEWIAILICKYNQAPKRNAWEDFNCQWKAYKEFKLMTGGNRPLMFLSDMPEQADPTLFDNNVGDRDCSADVTLCLYNQETPGDAPETIGWE